MEAGCDNRCDYVRSVVENETGLSTVYQKMIVKSQSLVNPGGYRGLPPSSIEDGL